jgi:hypothetical protein
MRRAALLVLLAAALAAADDGRRSNRRRDRDVDVVVPVDPTQHDRMQWFDGRPHGLVPRVIAVNKSPYRCDADGRKYETEDDFLYHLRSIHKLSWDDIGERLVVRDGQVHYLGR